jgi:SAM-dependent methyltransferase
MQDVETIPYDYFMSHSQQLSFLKIVIGTLGNRAETQRVLEIGSYDVNGTIRDIVGAVKEYIGVDLIDGPGVDLVAFGHELEFKSESFDLTLSAECFEHDLHWANTFHNMIRLTKPNGIVAFTCASYGRPEHGTLRSDPSLSPGTQSLNLDYYRNLTENDFQNLFDFADFFSNFIFYYNPMSWDLYFMGVKKSLDLSNDSRIKFPSSQEIESQTRKMTLSHRIIRLPLRILLRLVPLSIYNNIAFRYWRILVRCANRLGIKAV